LAASSRRQTRRKDRPADEARHVEEQLCLEARRHSVVLLRPLVLALVLAGGGGLLALRGWPLPVVGAALLAVAALVALRAVWRWDRTRIVVTTEKLSVVRGTLRRRSAAVPFRSVDGLGLEQTILGRILGYGTLVAGSLQVSHVPQARRVYRLVEDLSSPDFRV
jgi:uncharacterized membrane protein YdbT with pleckstrin-like domain